MKRDFEPVRCHIPPSSASARVGGRGNPSGPDSHVSGREGRSGGSRHRGPSLVREPGLLLRCALASEDAHGLPMVLFSGKPTLLAVLWKLSLESLPGQKGMEQIL